MYVEFKIKTLSIGEGKTSLEAIFWRGNRNKPDDDFERMSQVKNKQETWNVEKTEEEIEKYLQDEVETICNGLGNQPLPEQAKKP